MPLWFQVLEKVLRMMSMRNSSWIVYAASLATTFGVVFIFCEIFDALFTAPFGFIRWIQPASPLPITGCVTAALTGFVMFIVVGFLVGDLYGIASTFWTKRLA